MIALPVLALATLAGCASYSRTDRVYVPATAPAYVAPASTTYVAPTYTYTPTATVVVPARTTYYYREPYHPAYYSSY
jgi:hypothetical protein